MMRACLAQKYQKVDHNGVPFNPSSWRGKKALANHPLRLGAGVVAKCGDWSWFKTVLGLRGWSGDGASKKICWLCQAGLRNPTERIDTSSSAAWRTTMLLQAKFWEHACAEQRFVSAF